MLRDRRIIAWLRRPPCGLANLVRKSGRNCRPGQPHEFALRRQLLRISAALPEMADLMVVGRFVRAKPRHRL